MVHLIPTVLTRTTESKIMSKKSRPKTHRSKNEAATGNSIRSRYAAASSSWPDMDYRPADDPVRRPSTTVSVDRRPIRARKQPVKKAPVPSSTALFGPWTIQTPPKVNQRAVRVATPCEARAERRQVMFATRNTGAGSTAPKRKFTNRSCK